MLPFVLGGAAGTVLDMLYGYCYACKDIREQYRKAQQLKRCVHVRTIPGNRCMRAAVQAQAEAGDISLDKI
jgi:hypothetical protein